MLTKKLKAFLTKSPKDADPAADKTARAMSLAAAMLAIDAGQAVSHRHVRSMEIKGSYTDYRDDAVAAVAEALYPSFAAVV